MGFGHSPKMVNRRFTQVATSDDEDDSPPRPSKQQSGTTTSTLEDNRSKALRKRKRMKLQEEEDEEEEEKEKEKEKKKRKPKEKQEDEETSDEEDEPPQEDAKPIGEPVRVSGKGRGRRKHFESFEYDGNEYTLVYHLILTLAFSRISLSINVVGIRGNSSRG